jgi:hypothetical protein
MDDQPAQPQEPGHAEVSRGSVEMPNQAWTSVPATPPTPTTTSPTTSSFFIEAPGAPAPPRFRPARILALAVSLVALGGMAFAGIKLFSLRGSPDALVTMVPGDADVYATAYLDPAFEQKLRLHALIGKFPAGRSEADLKRRLDDFLDQGLAEAGLKFERDVRPWLGSQIALVSRLRGTSSETALLIRSKDDDRAARAMATAKAHTPGTWTKEIHGGITVNVGPIDTEASDGSRDVYALFDHTVVVGQDSAVIDDIIDADQGATSRLADSPAYHAATDPLPKQRLGTLYVDLVPYVKRLEQAIRENDIPDISAVTSSLGNLEAFIGVGMSVAAEQTGIAAEVHVSIDQSKLTAEARQQLRSGSHRNAVLGWIPAGSYGFFTAANLQRGLKSELEQVSRLDSEAKRNIDDLGVLDPNGALSDLSGDGGLVVSPGITGSSVPGFGFLAATTDAAAMQRFLDRAAVKLADAIPQAAGDSGSAPAWHRHSYRGVSIATLSSPDLAEHGVEPSYAVTDGMVVLASTTGELENIVDTHLDGHGLAQSASYVAAQSDAPSDAGETLYLDIESILSGLRGHLDPAFDAPDGPGPNIRPMKAFILSGSSTSTGASVRMFLVIR